VTGKLVLENLKHRPMRSLLTVLLVAVPVTLQLTLVGLTHGMLEDSQQRQAGIGADLIVRPSTVTSAIGMSGVTIPEHVIDKIEEQPHVVLAIGEVAHALDLPLVLMGIDLPSFDRMSGGFHYLKGGPLRSPNDILIDDLYAGQRHLKVGDTVKLLNRDWRVAGIFQTGKLARLVVDMHVLEDLEAATGKVSQIYVKVDKPENIASVEENLARLMPNFKTIRMQDFIAMFNAGQVPGIREFTWVVVGIGVVIGFAVVCLSMYMAVLQRTREIGILKALGASKGFILGIILAEALFMGVGGTILGVILSFGSYWLIHVLVPASIQMVIVPEWWPIAGLITLGGAALGAVYPGLSAARHDPIEALAYE